MKVTDNRRKVILGIFIVIGLVIFVLGIFTLGSQKKTFIKSITINVVFNDIQGLKEGGNIWFSGVKVGTIKNIQFYGTSQVQVFMNIEKQTKKYIHKDAEAKISSDGLIGNKIIVITSGSLKFPLIEDGDRIRVSTTLTTDEMMKTFQVSNKNLVDITSDLKTLTANLGAGKGTAGALLSDEKLAQNFRTIVLNLKSATEATNKMVTEMNTFSRKLNTKNGLTDRILTDTVIFARFQASADEFEKAARSASTLTENMNKASSKLNAKDNPAGLLLNDQQSAEQIRQILDNLESSTHNLNEDLKALQSNFLFRGYFRKKQKEAAN